jgi:hypothetical protein
VPPELLFDRGLGELFIVRNAGNTLDTAAFGSIEYAVGELGIPSADRRAWARTLWSRSSGGRGGEG